MIQLRRVYLIFTLALLGCLKAHGQGSEPYGKGLKIDLDSTQEKYLRLIFWNQIWMRAIEHNPGTLVNDVPVTNTWDISARRLRFLGYAQISPRYLVLFHIGINNQTFATGGAPGNKDTGPNGAGKKPQVFVHDAWNEYAILPTFDPETKERNRTTLYFGAGLHYWNGLSRMTSASTLNFLTLDAPMVNWPLVENSDQFVRQFGLYIKGKMGNIYYRLHLNKPFATNLPPPDPDPTRGPTAVDNNGTAKPALGGYFEYQFLDHEENQLPFRVGTYLATKRVFNVGAGFYHNGEGTMSKAFYNNVVLLNKHDISLFAVDVFADLPVGAPSRNMAFTGYTVFYTYNMGPNYLRTIGIMNPASGLEPGLNPNDATLNGPGNARMFVGTGNIWYTQAGFLLPGSAKQKFRIQPYAAYTFKNLEALDQNEHAFDIGCNFFLDGHHAKFTPQFSTRQLFGAVGERTVKGTRGEFLLQFQVYL